MDHKHIRPWFEVLRRIGSRETSGDVELRTPVQAVAALDDLRHLVPPLVVPEYWWRHQQAAGGAGQFARAELVVGGQGIWLYGVRLTITTGYRLWTEAARTGLAATVLPTAANSTAFGDGRPSLCQVDHGTDAAAAPLTAMVIDSTLVDMYHFGPVFVAPGRVVSLRANNNNVIRELGFFWREIPLRG